MHSVRNEVERNEKKETRVRPPFVSYDNRGGIIPLTASADTADGSDNTNGKFTPGRTITYYMSQSDNSNKGYIVDYAASNGLTGWGNTLKEDEAVESKKTVSDGSAYCTYTLDSDRQIDFGDGEEKAYTIMKTYSKSVPAEEIKAEGKETSPNSGNIGTIGVGGGSLQRFLAYNTMPDGSGTWYRYGQTIPEDVDELYVKTISYIKILSITNLAKGSSISLDMDGTGETSRENPKVIGVHAGAINDDSSSLNLTANFTFDDTVAQMVFGRTDEINKQQNADGNGYITHVDLNVKLDSRLHLKGDDDSITVKFTGGFIPYVDGKVLEPDVGTRCTYTFKVNRSDIADNSFTITTVLDGAEAAENPDLLYEDFKSMKLEAEVDIPEDMAEYAADPGSKEPEESFIKAEGNIHVEAARTGSATGTKGDLEADPIYAQLQNDIHKIEYVTNGGDLEDGAADSVICGKTFSEPGITRVGYVFKGWYVDEAMTEAYDFSTPVIKDVKLYAKWVSDQSPGGETDKPGDGNQEIKTGDDSNMIFWLSVMAAALCGTAILIFYGRKIREK